MNDSMRMTKELADTLMDALACLAISAIGVEKAAKDEMGERERVMKYAREKFTEITGEWENEMCKRWEVFDGEKEPRFQKIGGLHKK